MAKKKNEEGALSDIESILANYKKKHGGIVTTGKDLLTTKPELVSVSPSLDMILGNGVPRGSYLTIAGPPKYGKTTLALHLAANLQRQDPSAHVFFHDIEWRLKEKNMDGCKHLDEERFHVVRSEKGTLLSGEHHLQMMQEEISSFPGCIVISDSFGSLRTENDMTKDISGTKRPTVPKLLSDFFNHITDVLKINNVILVGINHVYKNISGYGATNLESSGEKSKYFADIRLRITGLEKWENPQKEPIGQKVKFVCDEQANGPPGGECITLIRYGIGIDELSEVIQLAQDTGLISIAGAWQTASFMQNHDDNYDEKEYKVQGGEAMYQFLLEHPVYVGYLREDLNAMVG